MQRHHAFKVGSLARAEATTRRRREEPAGVDACAPERRASVIAEKAAAHPCPTDSDTGNLHGLNCGLITGLDTRTSANVH